MAQGASPHGAERDIHSKSRTGCFAMPWAQLKQTLIVDSVENSQKFAAVGGSGFALCVVVLVICFDF